MENFTKQCGICYLDYADTEDNKPKILLCGHSFCLKCLRTLEQGDKKCPACRADWSKWKVEELPVCFQLLPELVPKVNNSSFAEKCQRHLQHSTSLTFFCRTCEKSACRKCVSTYHQRCDCSVVDAFVDVLRDEVMVNYDMQEWDCNQALAVAEEALSKVTNERLAVKKLMDELQTYDKTLTSQEEIISLVKGKLVEDASSISEKRKAISYEKDSDALVAASLESVVLPRTTQVEKLTHTNLSILVKAFFEVCDEPTIQSFTTSFKNFVEARLNEPVIDPNVDNFKDKGEWNVESCSAGLSCLNLLKSASVRPTKLTVTVDVPWARSTLEIFLTTIATLKCHIHLNFTDTLKKPTPESIEDNERRLSCFKIENRKCTIIDFVGAINVAVAQLLLDVTTNEGFSLTFPLEGGTTLYGLRIITTSSKYRACTVARNTAVVVRRGSYEDSFSELPPLRPYMMYEIRFLGLGNGDLEWMLQVVRDLNINPQVGYVKFPESSVTESGLDRFLGHLLDHTVTSPPKIHVGAPCIDEAGRKRTQDRYTQHGYQNLIQWIP